MQQFRYGLHLPTALFSFLLGALVLASSGASGVQSQWIAKPLDQPGLGHSWGPEPSDLVLIHDELVTEMTPGNLTFNSLTPIYQVPVDKWLVVTHYSWDSACCDAAYVVELVDGNTSVRIEIDPNGSTSPSETWPIGYAFSPGSTVALQPLGNVSNASFTMLGYLRN